MLIVSTNLKTKRIDVAIESMKLPTYAKCPEKQKSRDQSAHADR